MKLLSVIYDLHFICEKEEFVVCALGFIEGATAGLLCLQK